MTKLMEIAVATAIIFLMTAICSSSAIAHVYTYQLPNYVVMQVDNESASPSLTPTQNPTPTPTSSPTAAPPVISSVIPILASRLQTIRIHGSGFGNTQPQLINLGDGSVDTIGAGTTPVIRIYDEGNLNNWEAGVQDSPNSGGDSIGVILVSWSDTDIVLGGFGIALSTNGTGQWSLSTGDPLLIAVLTNKGQAVYTAVAGSSQSSQMGVQPKISSVTPIAAALMQKIVISGSGFGNIQPQLMNLSDGSVDTVIGGASPVIRIYDEAGLDSWEAGCTDSQWVPKDNVGIYLISWSDSEIVLGGFGTELNVNGQGSTNISPGDPLIIDLVTSNGQAAYATTAVSNQTIQNPSPTPNPSAPTLTIACQSSTTYSNFQVEITGSLIADQQGVPFTPIQLSYSVNGGNSWNDLTLVNTDSNGNFLAVWNPAVTGDYLLNAEWAGNDEYLQVNTTVSFVVTPFEKESVFSVQSNSTLSEISFNSTTRELSFVVSGPPGTTGYVDVYFAKSLINDASTLNIRLDGNQIPYTAQSIGDSWLISFAYHHSTHQVTMNLNATSPSIPTRQIILWAIYGVIADAIAIVTILLFLRKRRTRKMPSA